MRRSVRSSSRCSDASVAAVANPGDDVVGAALERGRDAMARVAGLLCGGHLVARQLTHRDYGRRTGDAHMIGARPLLDSDDRRVRLDLRDEVLKERLRVHQRLLGGEKPSQHRATRVPATLGRAMLCAFALLLALVALGAVVDAAPSTHVSEQTVHDVSAQLRCVVCQNLSVADSPSEMAAQMRGIVRERLEAGETPEQVREYFVARYGEWILLAPRRTGFNLLVWGFPLAALAVGFTTVALLLRRWTGRRRVAAAPAVVDPAMRERIRREMETQ